MYYLSLTDDVTPLIEPFKSVKKKHTPHKFQFDGGMQQYIHQVTNF